MTHFLLDIMPSGDMQSIRWDFQHEIWPLLKILVYAIAAVFGLIAGLRIYNLWNINGRAHVHIDAEVIGWGGACIFLIVATTFIDMVLLP